jgi:transcriptional antiterminator RfaH
LTRAEFFSAKADVLSGVALLISAFRSDPSSQCDDGATEPARRWYVVQTHPRREAGVVLQLEAQHFRAFLPRMTRTVRHARKLRLVEAPVFPGYLFVSLDLGRDRWRSVNGTFGAVGLIMGDEFPSATPRGVVESLLAYADARGSCRFDRDLVEGQRVKVLVGPFADAIGSLVRLDANERVRVLLDIMGGQVPATLERSALVAV